ncbi:hypothetical protein FOZ63_001866 [Perkinsus olseni]|uniref:Cytochrome P450 n=1 Tax=Perkinsus olseni TaxID=32597 RepID=A0A7J6S9Y9_PEROL|nr:hypothetical protein FOZ63_001866 [Perkinsus olseni]
MTYLPAAAQELIAKCRWFLQSRRKLILATSVTLVLTLRALKFINRPKVDLHARFGGPNRVSSSINVYLVFIEHMVSMIVVNLLRIDHIRGVGSALGRSSQEVQQALRDTIVGSGHASLLSIFPWMTRDRFPWNLNPFIKKLHLGIKRLNELCDEIASGRQAERQAGVQASRRDLLDKLLHLDQEDLRGNIITFFIAGSDTSAMSVAWCLYYLCLNPCIQNQARAEVDALGRDPETMKDVDELPLVECCVLEALRLQPPSVMLLNECITDTSLKGKTIPSGTLVVTLLRKAMVQESQGGTNFKPERWLTHDGSAVDRPRTREHLAFGDGPRQCPGQRMALIEATTIISLILRHFDNLKLKNSPESVRGDLKFSYGPKNFELVMFPRHH